MLHLGGVDCNNCSCVKRRKKKNCSSYRGCKLFLSKDRFEVVSVDCGIANIPPFRIDIPSSNESIWFGTKIIRAELNNKIELGEVLGPYYNSKPLELDYKVTLYWVT